MKTEIQQIHDTLREQFCSETITHAAFLLISRTATEHAIKRQGIEGLDKYFALQDHATELLAEDMGLDLPTIRRAEAALRKVQAVLAHMDTLDTPIPEGQPIWQPRKN